MSTPVFEPFTWYSDSIKHFPHISRLNRIKSLSSGLFSVLSMIEASGLREEAGEDPLFNQFHEGNLYRIAIEVAYIISEECDAGFEWAAERRPDHGSPDQVAREKA